MAALLTLCSTGFAAEPVAPFVAGFDRFARHGEIDELAAGRLLLSELSCTACHAPDDASLDPKRGPRLDGVADRLHDGWMRQFLLAPDATKPGTTMPDVLAGLPIDERESAADALIAFLSTQHEAYPELKAGGGNPVVYRFWEKGDQERGRELYHQVGCVACHEPDGDYEASTAKPSALDELLEQLDPEEIRELGLSSAARPTKSVPHGDLAAKYSHKSLTFFLLDPAAVRPAGRMPSLKLSPSEAADVAAWLLRDQQQIDAVPTDHAASLVEEGRRLFGELRCANCHSAGEVKPVPAKPMLQLGGEAARSCLGQTTEGLPHYEMDASQLAVIRTAMKAIAEHPDVPPAQDAAAQTRFHMLQLNCFACHERDGQGGVGRNRRAYFETVGHVDIGDEGRLPPPLTGVGRKLEVAWIDKVLSGTGDVRPYMTIRMPHYPAPATTSLPELFAEADQPTSAPKQDPFIVKDELAEAGRTLMDVGCVQCHLFRGEGLPGVVGVDLADVTSRLRPEWFREFLLDPNQLKLRTRMPSFFPGGKSQNPAVLDGDPQRQIAAMWAYLKAGVKQSLPEKIEAARRLNFELKPADRPIIFRTFMPEAGTHAIAVGFPAGVHFAFDAESMRLAQAWRGRFLDAQGTWFSRFTPPAEPLGEDVIPFPPGVPLAWLKEEKLPERPRPKVLAQDLDVGVALLKHSDQPWPTTAQEQGYRFDGYRLDESGVPTFLYRLNSMQVEDRIEPDGKAGLKRRITLKADGDPPEGQLLWFRVSVSNSLRGSGGSFSTENFGFSWEPRLAADVYQLNNERWSDAVRLAVDDAETFQIDYSWRESDK